MKSLEATIEQTVKGVRRDRFVSVDEYHAHLTAELSRVVDQWWAQREQELVRLLRELRSWNGELAPPDLLARIDAAAADRVLLAEKGKGE